MVQETFYMPRMYGSDVIKKNRGVGKKLLPAGSCSWEARPEIIKSINMCYNITGDWCIWDDI